MKKIAVNGCATCPYLTVYNDGEDNGFDSISHGRCNHPAFNRELPTPIVAAETFFDYGMPDWCPLPDNSEKASEK
jgi:hypothetical protein